MYILNSTTSWASPIAVCKSFPDIYSEIQSYIAIPHQPKEKHLSPQWNLSQTYRQDEGEIDRKTLNLSFHSMPFLVLDYDNDSGSVGLPNTSNDQEGGKIFSIADFEAMFKGFEYSLYTTSSHTIEIPRFRAILPMNGAVPRENLEAFKASRKYLYTFPGADKASFEISRWMIQPQSGPGRVYEHRFNEGVKYPHQNLMEPVPAKVERRDSKEIKHPELYLKKALPGILEEIQAFNINNRGGSRGTYNQIYIFYVKLYRLHEKCGSHNPDQEAKRILLGYASHPTTIKDIQGKRI